MKLIYLSATILFAQTFAITARADVQTELRKAYAAIGPVLEAGESLVVEGRLDEASQKLQSVFPADSRTAVQALVLGSVLFKQEPRISYELHKRAAAELPDEPNAILEWALEQHRAGEYAGAAKSYDQYAQTHPQYAPVFGLLAECLLRDGKLREAVDAWQRSEQAAQGTLEQFESLVCEVNGRKYPDRARANYREQARKGDLDAAERLIALDSAFETDWWNKAPRPNYLKVDLKLLRESKFDEPQRLREMFCAAECELARAERRDVAETLRKHGFLFDAPGSLPRNGVMLSIMLGAAEAAEAVTTEAARAKWGAAILDAARTRRDAELFNVASHLYVGTEKLAEIERRGWELAGDERCVTGLLFGLAEQDQLRLDHPLFVKASQQFPENALLAGIAVTLAKQEGKPLQPSLVRAIKAEYAGFSLQKSLFPRPGAAALRKNFSMLAAELDAS